MTFQLPEKICVFGLGVSGLASLELLRKKGASPILVGQGAPKTWSKGLDLAEGLDAYDQAAAGVETLLSTMDLIILAPGIDKALPVLKLAISSGVKIWNDLELAYRYWDSSRPIIAVTGTNGKTTTVELMTYLLEAMNKKVFKGGNIGIPFSKAILAAEDFDIAVLELSSFQLESIESFRPDVGVLLNLSMSHGERYDSLKKYAHAKFHLSDYMTKDDLLLVPQAPELVCNWKKSVKCQTKVIDLENIQHSFQELDVSNFRLLGSHNKANLGFTIQALLPFGLTQNLLNKSLFGFMGVPHRLQIIETKSKLAIFNDAKSTNWDSTLSALSAVQDLNLPVYLILGGKLRGEGDSIRPYLKMIQKQVKKIYLIGESQDFLGDEIDEHIEFEKCGNLISVLEKTKLIDSGVILYSPAFPSFDQYKNYVERGEEFLKYWNEPI